MISVGAVLVILTVGSFLALYSLPMNWAITCVGAALLIVGIVILITELMEVWLTRSQKALVDGLQAG